MKRSAANYVLLVVWFACLGVPVAYAQQPRLSQEAPSEEALLSLGAHVEVIGAISQVRAGGREFSISGESYSLASNATVTDESGTSLSLDVLRNGVRVGLIQQGGTVTHAVVYLGRQ